MHLLEVRHLLLVAAVADDGNLTRAGSRLNLTQSALSHQLLDIEERLGTPLFHRVNRRMVLTEAGERVLTSARRVLADLAHTEEELRLFAADKRGVIRLTTECYTCYHWLPDLMKRFQRLHPGIEIRIDVDATDHPFQSLLAGEIDVALVTSDSADKGIDLKPLFENELLVLLSPEHRLAGREFIKAQDLAEETLLTYSALADSYVYQRILRPAGKEPNKHMQVRLTEAMIELVKAGLGVAVMAQWGVAPYIESGSVVGVPLTRKGLSYRWKAAVLGGRPLPSFLSEFIQMLAQESPRALRHTTPLPRLAASRKRAAAR